MDLGHEYQPTQPRRLRPLGLVSPRRAAAWAGSAAACRGVAIPRRGIATRLLPLLLHRDRVKVVCSCLGVGVEVGLLLDVARCRLRLRLRVAGSGSGSGQGSV